MSAVKIYGTAGSRANRTLWLAEELKRETGLAYELVPTHFMNDAKKPDYLAINPNGRVPAMDDDDLRRGRPTCHKAFDEATALLAGDALQTLAFECLAHHGPVSLPASARLGMVRCLAAAAGSAGMAGGQAIDLAAVGRKLDAAEVEQMHRLKTGALLSCSIELAAHAAASLASGLAHGAAANLRTFGEQLGLAFQIVDDLLDVEGDAALLGKATGADAARDKPTYPAAVGVAAAKAKAAELTAAALEALQPFGAAGMELAGLARFVIQRAY